MTVHSATLALHIIAGSLGILLGFVALFVVKGGRLHRRSGRIFGYAMLVMGLVGATMAAVWGRQPASNIPIGLLTAYLVTTGWMTVRPPSAAWRWTEAGLMTLALALGLFLWGFGSQAIASHRGTIAGIPVPMFFAFGAIALSAAFGDFRLIRAGGFGAIRGAPRLSRHLWRMAVALVIAAFSFFLGQSQVIPKPIRILPLLITPPLLALGALFYWLWRVRWRRSTRGIVVVAPVAPERITS